MHLDGRHLHDLVDILQRTGDVPQRRLVRQLFGTWKHREKVGFLYQEKMPVRIFFFDTFSVQKIISSEFCDCKPIGKKFWHVFQIKQQLSKQQPLLLTPQ